MKKAIWMITIICIACLSQMAMISNTYAVQHIPKSDMITAYSSVTPEEFAVRFNQAVASGQYGASEWMYVGTPVYTEDGEFNLRNSPNYDNTVNMYLTTDNNGYVNWVAILTPKHYTVCGNQETLDLIAEARCVMSALTEGKRYKVAKGYLTITSSDIHGDLTRLIDLRLHAEYGQHFEFKRLNSMIIKRYWDRGNMIFLSIRDFSLFWIKRFQANLTPQMFPRK